MASSSSQPIRGAYYSRYSVNIDPAAHHRPVNIDPAAIAMRYFTHIFYADINPEASLRFEINEDDGQMFINFTNTLRANNPLVKILFSVGGLFDSIVSSPDNRHTFIRSSIEVAREYGFDGVDLDWEFPNNEEEMANFGSLLEEWRVEEREDAKINGRQEPLLLTAAVYYRNTIPSKNNLEYPADSLNRNLDFINVMTYDYYEHNTKDPYTGAHTALFDLENIQNNVCTSAGLKSWCGVPGVDKSKLIMGLPLFGRTWTLADPANNGIRARAVGPGEGDTDVGMLTYANVVRYNNEKAANVVHHEATKSVYSVSESEKHWMSYDNHWSVREKIEHARTKGYGGYFFWQVGGDDNWILSRTALESWP